MAGNSNLHMSKAGKTDEFYTQLSTIEEELRHYRKYFKGKTVLCNCDDPYESNFFKYFALNFNALGLKKLITTCYATSPITYTQLYLFADEEITYPAGEGKKPYKIEITEVTDANGDANGNANPDDLLTRAQTAALCNRLVGRNSTSSSMNGCTGVKGWPDNANSAWYYADILEATNAHNYTWTLNVKNVVSGEFVVTEQWTNIRTDAPDWTK